MKVLHVNDIYDERGGVQQYLIAVAGLLASAGHENVVVYRHQSIYTVQDSQWPAYHLKEENEIEIATELLQVLVCERPDVAYIHHVSSPEVVNIVTQLLPSVAYVHGFNTICPGLAKYFRRGDRVCERAFGWGCIPMHYLRRCSDAQRPSTLVKLMDNTANLRKAFLQVPYLLVATNYMRKLLIQNEFDSSRITLLSPHFLVDDRVPPYIPPTDPDTLLYVGRLEIEKGMPYLLHAMSLLPNRIRLVIAGDGSLRQEYERLSLELGIADRVEFLGWVTTQDIKSCYQRCGIIIMPSICPESFGKAGIEALTYGRPVIAFAVGGIPDWLDDGITGLLAKPADSADLAAKIQALSVESGLQEAMGYNGQRLVVERYAAYRHLGTLEAALNDAIAAHE